MEEALVRILTPKRSIDILRDVHAAKEQRKPYVVVFVGVNGVGKSTNLAKVKLCRLVYFFIFFLPSLFEDEILCDSLCSNGNLQVAYWLQQHDIKVMMAACDTFRSGAVEQLRTHARRLQVYLLMMRHSILILLLGLFI